MNIIDGDYIRKSPFKTKLYRDKVLRHCELGNMVYLKAMYINIAMSDIKDKQFIWKIINLETGGTCSLNSDKQVKKWIDKYPLGFLVQDIKIYETKIIVRVCGKENN